MDDKQAQAIIGLLNAYYPKADMPDSTVIAWALQLRPYSYEDAKWAVEQTAASSKWLPALSDILGTIRHHRSDNAPNYELPAPATSRINDRIAERLSPCDDDLAFLDARTDQRMRNSAVDFFRERRFETQPASAALWERIKEAQGEGATPRTIGAEVLRIVKEDRAR